MNQIVLAAAESEHSIVPYVIGGGTLIFLLFLLVVLMQFGAGRDHS